MPQELFPHIDHALVPKPHPPMYLMHKFWARKPHNVVAEYIKHYSKKGDIVLDPFCGSGVTAIEALKHRRKTVAIDLNPISTFMTRMTIIPLNLQSYVKAYELIKEKIKKSIESLYETKCPQCGKKANTICTRWNKGTPVEIRNLICPSCGMIRHKKIDEEDKQKIDSIEEMEIPFWYPKNDLIYKTGEPFKEGTHDPEIQSVSSLFTKRNLISLSMLYHEIESIEDENIRDLMKFTFSSMLAQASKMMIWSKSSRPSWKVHRYWVPDNNVELNVWDRFENRYEKILSGKKALQEIIGDSYKEGKTFCDLLNDRTCLFSTQSALNLKEKPASIPSNSVDYVFTDPPYGGSIQYMELSYLWASWLSGENKDPRFQMAFDEEVTINDSQQKKFSFYDKMLRASFEEIYRVLKVGSWLTVTFHNTSIRIYNSIIKSIVLAGFDLDKIVYQPPAKKGAKQQLQPYGSAIGDYYIRFQKPKISRGARTESEIAKERYERIIVEAVKKLIASRGEPTPYSLIINSYSRIYNELKKNGYYLSNPQGIDKILKKHLKKEFTIVNGKWWFTDPDSVPFIERVPLNERVEISVIDILNHKVKVSFDEVLQHIFITFPNCLTPDTRSIIDVLDEFAKKTKDGKWILDSYVRKRISEHDHIVELLANIGKKIGFNVHADIAKHRVATIPSIPKENLKGAKEIDVIWFTKNQVTHEFEVENTTGIWSAIIRGSNISNAKVRRFIVIPEERQRTFYNKINVPALKERVETEEWRFILYDDLKTFFYKNRRKQKIELDSFEEIAKKPKMPKKEVENLETFL